MWGVCVALWEREGTAWDDVVLVGASSPAPAPSAGRGNLGAAVGYAEGAGVGAGTLLVLTPRAVLPGWGSCGARRGCCLCTQGCHGSLASAKAEIRERDPWEARRGPGGLSVLLLRSRLRRWLQVMGRGRRGQG